MSHIPTFLNLETENEYMKSLLDKFATRVLDRINKKEISDEELNYYSEGLKQASEVLVKATAALKSRSSPLAKYGIHEGTQYAGPTSYQNQPYPNWSYQNQHLSGLKKDLGRDVPTSSQIGVSKQLNKSAKLIMKPKNVQMKRKVRKERDSTGSRMFKEFMVKQSEKQDRLIEILEYDAFGVNKDDPYSASRCMSVINDMLDGGMMLDDSPLCYLAMDLFEDPVKRELFMTMRSDASRLKWLQHKQYQGK